VPLHKMTVARSPCVALALTLLLAGCGGSSGSNATTSGPLSARNLNLIFVVSEDKAFQASGDVNPATANLTDQGLQRSLLMATFLRRRVLGDKNVTGVYALEAMTHLQPPGGFPDMAAAVTIQQFALLNQITLTGDGQTYTANSYPLNASYASGAVPSGVATPAVSCTNCRGLDFADQGGDNETLVSGIITANVPGFYVFSAPWETVSTLLTNINQLEGYNLTVPGSYVDPNHIYAISIVPSGSARRLPSTANRNRPRPILRCPCRCRSALHALRKRISPSQ
jgi:hypothetical protein